MNDAGWQKIINEFGVDVAFQFLLNEFHKHESLEQPSPNISVPMIATDGSVATTAGKEGEGE